MVIRYSRWVVIVKEKALVCLCVYTPRWRPLSCSMCTPQSKKAKLTSSCVKLMFVKARTSCSHFLGFDFGPCVVQIGKPVAFFQRNSTPTQGGYMGFPTSQSVSTTKPSCPWFNPPWRCTLYFGNLYNQYYPSPYYLPETLLIAKI